MEDLHNRLIELEKLRSEIWKMALEATDESALVQSLLDKTGSRLQCENITFLAPAPGRKNYIVHQQWRADGQNIGLSEKVPKWIFKPYLGRPWIQISLSKVPMILKPFMKLMQARYGTISTLVIPYGDPAKPEGYLTLNQYLSDRLFDEQEISLITELSQIIRLRSNQLRAIHLLRTSNQKFRQLFNQHPAIKLIIDAESGKITEANEKAMEFYGFDRKTLTGIKFPELNPDQAEQLSRDMAEAALGLKPVFSFRHKSANGQWLDMEVFCGIFSDVGKKFLYLIIHDVTRRRQAEKSIQHLSELLSSTEELARAGSYEVDLNENKVFLSRSLAGLFGLPLKDFYTIQEIQEFVYSEDRAQVREEFARCLNEHKDFYAEFRYQHSDGRILWANDRARIEYDDSGKACRIIGTKQDITSRIEITRQTEQSLNKFRSLINNLQMGVLVESSERTIVHANQHFCDLFGIPNPEMLTGLDCSLAAQGASQIFQYPDLFLKRIEQILKEGQLVKNEKLQLKDGRIFSRDYLVIQDEYEFQGNMWLYRDITPEDNLEKQVIRQERLAAIGQISAGLAHEFNNILTSILGFSDLLVNLPDLPENARTYISQIKISGQKAAGMVRQIMDFSRKSIRRMKHFDLSEKIEDIVHSLRADFPLRIQFIYEPEPGPFIISADENQIRQMITHLILNAMDAIEVRGEIRLSLSRIELDGEINCVVCTNPLKGEWFRLTVSDNGCGIPAEILPKIFEPFFTTKVVGKGTGLGLSQISGIVVQSGGHITLESKPGKGTNFHVYLPRPQSPGTPDVHFPASLKRGNSTGVLLIEPDPAVLKVTRSITEFLDYKVFETDSLAEADKIIRANKIEIKIVLCSLAYPEPELHDFFNRLDETGSALHFAFMTDEINLEQFKIKFNRFNPVWIKKPILIEQMSTALHSLLT